MEALGDFSHVGPRCWALINLLNKRANLGMPTEVRESVSVQCATLMKQRQFRATGFTFDDMNPVQRSARDVGQELA